MTDLPTERPPARSISAPVQSSCVCCGGEPRKCRQRRPEARILQMPSVTSRRYQSQAEYHRREPRAASPLGVRK